MALSFPTLRICADGFEPRGAFAEAQAAYLRPDRASVATLDELLRAKSAGVVAHFYMDAELQGVLAGLSWPHVFIADSLAMADHAVKMATAGIRAIVVLGVDFMSENVRATLDATGFAHVPVYRVAREPIGCSLAEAAEAPAYMEYLRVAAATPRSLHVLYINTSLRVKAEAQALVPTITCTSSNVVATILQAAAQVPNLTVWFGPDTYMGENLRELFRTLAELGDGAVRAVHEAHDRASVTSLLERFRYFRHGVCVVHHMFDAQVAARVARDYGDAFITAHLEVPGEMFRLALAAQARGHGVVGSTSSILDFIRGKVASVEGAYASPAAGPLRFILGTESGMVTSIARAVQRVQRDAAGHGRQAPDVEIVFPVAGELVAPVQDRELRELRVVPGASGSEGCSVAGGCATCPYMKMNSLSALLDLAHALDPADPKTLEAFTPRRRGDLLPGTTRSIADLASESILHMRAFQRTKRLPDALVARVLEARHAEQL